jgi:hypothetical protein
MSIAGPSITSRFAGPGFRQPPKNPKELGTALGLTILDSP